MTEALSEGQLDLSQLSARERDVLDAATEGLSVRDMARRLSLSEATVRSHLSAIYSKLGVSGRLELLARLSGMTAPKQTPPAPSEAIPATQVPRAAHRDRRVLAGVVVLLLAASAAGAFLMIRPDLPTRTDVATVAELMGSNAITSLELRGDTLTVTLGGGERMRVEGITNDEWMRIQPGPNRRAMASSARSDPQSIVTDLAMMATAVLPLVLLGALLALIARALVRPTGVRPAG